MKKSYGEENETMMIFFKEILCCLSYPTLRLVGVGKIAFDCIVFVSQSFPFFFFSLGKKQYTLLSREHRCTERQHGNKSKSRRHLSDVSVEDKLTWVMLTNRPVKHSDRSWLSQDSMCEYQDHHLWIDKDLESRRS